MKCYEFIRFFKNGFERARKTVLRRQIETDRNRQRKAYIQIDRLTEIQRDEQTFRQIETKR